MVGALGDSQLDAELDGYFDSPEDAPPRWLLMLRAYLDESGHEGKGWMALAGYIGRKEQWLDFIPKWKAPLVRNASPSA